MGASAFEYFLKQKPDSFDIYLVSIYSGKLDDKNRVSDFSGLTLYMIKKNFYNTFLNLSEEENKDRALSNKGNFLVCDPFVAIQHPGYSDNTRQYCNYADYLVDRSLFQS